MITTNDERVQIIEWSVIQSRITDVIDTLEGFERSKAVVTKAELAALHVVLGCLGSAVYECQNINDLLLSRQRGLSYAKTQT